MRHRGVLPNPRAECALREGDRTRPRLPHRVLYPREEPERRMVRHARPPRRARRVAVVGRVFQCPRYACPVSLYDQVRREAGEPVVLRHVFGPPPRHGADPPRCAPAAQARRVRHRERATRRCGEHRHVSAPPDLLQQGRRHVVPEHVV
eukprot:985162-Pleurochrysis_carterae.AAC.1